MSEQQTSTPILSTRSYDVLKFIAQIFLPAVATLYFTLAGIWGLPKAEEIVGTITAVDFFLGVLLKLDKTAYNKSDARFDGVFHANVDEDGIKQIGVQLKDIEDPRDITDRKELLFKVQNNEVAG